MGNQKGITLIALILIIVVLIILAGISVALVLNNETPNEIQENNPTNELVVEDEGDNVEENFPVEVEEENLVEENTVVGNEIVDNTAVENEVDTIIEE